MIRPLALVLGAWLSLSFGTAADGSGADEGRRRASEIEIGAVHGGRAWEKHVAHVFLTGNDLFGNSCQDHHAPDRWRRRHLHLGAESDTSSYYRDGSIDGGQDTDPDGGIEVPTLLFYVGHGYPDKWQALTEWAPLKQTVAGNGNLKYLWMCSCNVMAHGPPVDAIPSFDADYREPWKFPRKGGGPDTDRMRNVFERWKNAFGPGLRLACGGSSRVCGGHSEVTNRIWMDYGTVPVADAFLHAVLPGPRSVPLCMTRGGADPNKTPLNDVEITTEMPTEDRSYAYIMYPYVVGSDKPETRMGTERVPPPKELPVWRTTEPAYLQSEDFSKRNLAVEGSFFVSADLSLLVNRYTGSWIYRGEPAVSEEIGDDEVPSRADILGRSLEALLARQDEIPGPQLSAIALDPSAGGGELLPGEVFRPESAYVFYIDRSRNDGATVTRFKGSTTARFRRWIVMPDEFAETSGVDEVPVLGPGGLLRVQVGPKGRLVSAVLAWHQLDRREEEPKRQPVLSLEKALEKARTRLEAPDRYEVDTWRWGYREESGTCRQSRLRIVYEIDFAAIEAVSAALFPPRRVEIAAQDAPANEPQCADPDHLPELASR